MEVETLAVRAHLHQRVVCRSPNGQLPDIDFTNALAVGRYLISRRTIGINQCEDGLFDGLHSLLLV